ncbi:M10 family metallopeptidase domain-containing protein [Aeoliella sp. ICT_H6.2]|uniref:M10 family metallopeptidase domain-containing protein n=1 Tax=Aeoliella straminimaris TaxID=2954799 RepID=A0A9X2F522_9BACT|nr:M10 family metallopeptidase domain-containing protein [Aeoliella straminimaris]MCO6042315.1 M10 family metallopeptidase domain-containing protein [Aeoliella straminimaris]
MPTFYATTKAVTINVSFSQFTDAPNFDPTGDKMLAIVNAAANYWEDIIEDPFVLDVEIGYENIGGNGRAAFACYATGPLNCIDGDVQPSTPDFGLIRFDTMQTVGRAGTNADGTLRWFFDSTPLDHSEFEMQQTLVRSLSPLNVAFVYSETSPPELMEAGMLGNASSPTNEFDAFTIAVHELGHLLGTLNEISLPETATDDAYDVNPDFVYGATVEIATNSGDGEHLASTIGLMRSTVSVDQRLLPSATDVFAIAAGADPDWAFIDLPRQDFLGGTLWDILANWEGNSIPDEDDSAFIRHGGDVRVLANHAVANLLIAEGSSLELDGNGNSLTVGNTLTIGGEGGGTAVMSVLGDKSITASVVRVRDDGRLFTSGSIFDVDVDAAEVIVEQGGLVSGTGRIRADNIRLSGTLTAIAPVGSLMNVLTLDANPGGEIDLDGTGSGQVFAVLASVSISGPLSDSFGGEITVGAGRSVFFDEPWTFGTPQLNGDGVGVLNLNGGSSDTQLATLDTQGWTARDGRINVSGRANILRATEFLQGVEVNVATDGFLDLDGVTTFRGGTYTGGGSIVLNNDTAVESDTTVEVSRFDLDGDSFGQTVTLNAPLTLNVDYIDTGNNNFNFDTIDINFNGRLAVNLNTSSAWTMASTLNINFGLFPQTVLDGVGVNITGTLNADGSSVVAAPLDVSGTFHFVDTQSRVTLSSAPFVRLSEHVIRTGATIDGGGTLVIGSTALLTLEDGVQIGENVENQGELQIGNSPGAAQVGFYSQSANASWHVEIAGTPRSGEFDQLDVVGQADLAGVLDVLLNDEYTPNVGDEFTVLTANRISNTFDELTVADEADILNVTLVALYSPNTVVLRIENIGLWGDYNGDGVVNAADYTVWRNNLGSPAGTLPNDPHGSPIGTFQYETWKSSFGNTLPESALRQLSAVPEPSAIAFVVQTGALLIMWACQRCTANKARQ